MTPMTGQAPTLSTWYAMPADGGEYPYTNPFDAHLKLDELGVAGDVELYSTRTGSRDLVASRQADGAWTLPDDEGNPDD
jgi:hypothetical protein